MNLRTHFQENHSSAIGYIGWKYYNTIKKKAMEQEFSWSGLFLSLSIAFFIVIVAALTLSLFYQSLQQTDLGLLNNEYILIPENSDNLDSSILPYYEKNEKIKELGCLFV
jgi:hypothetical protein